MFRVLQSIALQSNAAFDFAQKPELRPKNRFKNILPCESFCSVDCMWAAIINDGRSCQSKIVSPDYSRQLVEKPSALNTMKPKLNSFTTVSIWNCF